MPAPGSVCLSKGDCMMCLALAGLHRKNAANIAGVADYTFRRLMKHYRIQAPKSNTKLTMADVHDIRSMIGEFTEREIAAIKGIHWRTVQQVSNFETWYSVR